MERCRKSISVALDRERDAVEVVFHVEQNGTRQLGFKAVFANCSDAVARLDAGCVSPGRNEYARHMGVASRKPIDAEADGELAQDDVRIHLQHLERLGNLLLCGDLRFDGYRRRRDERGEYGEEQDRKHASPL